MPAMPAALSHYLRASPQPALVHNLGPVLIWAYIILHTKMFLHNWRNLLNAYFF